MTRTVDEAVADLSSPDGAVREQALALLVSYGRRATPVLVPLLESGDPELRAQAARALGFIADPVTADRLDALLSDADPYIRSHAAYGLFLIHDLRALDALIKTIDDYPHLTMVHSTLATDALIAMGEPALPRVVELLAAPSPETRGRARLVILTVAKRLPPTEASAWLSRIE